MLYFERGRREVVVGQGSQEFFFYMKTAKNEEKSLRLKRFDREEEEEENEEVRFELQGVHL